jgi:hypothetical protein
VSSEVTAKGKSVPLGFAVLTAAMLLGAAIPALAHEAPKHADPALLVGWRTWLHLTIQWVHLLGLAFWFSLTAAPFLLRLNPPLQHLLYLSWALFLVLLATGDYNMEHSAGIPEVPSLLSLPLLGRFPYGVTYTVTLGVKLGLFFLTVLFTAVITLLHVRHRFSETALRRAFLIVGSALGILLALVASAVLLLHEAADLWPTPLHSRGGVLGPEGPRGLTAAGSPPNDFRLLASRQVLVDIGVRWLHLLGFGLWLGGTAGALSFGGVAPGRYLVYTWVVLGIQVLSGIASMSRWTPFYLPSYPWNLDALSHLRFGRTYTLFMAVKQALVLAVLAVTGAMTVRYRKAPLRPFLVVSLLLGLTIAYIMIIVLLVHEGVDHLL